MKPISLQDRDPRHTGSNNQQADTRASARFRQMLEATAENLNPWVPQVPVQADVPVSANEAPLPRFTTTRGEAIRNGVPSLPKVLDTQELALRTVTGPLAGLTVQVRLSHDRLILKLITPSAERAQHMIAHQDELASALDKTLGMSVSLEVEHDPAC
ncbi:hypothetical protein ACUHMQ_14830 [Chitinimonas sp. PSY-7]|uniref:hypothetical protein n=1 Tax=Chitinimonas sp. PSY-7 TaxID=3459088 RepID=UPI004040397B